MKKIILLVSLIVVLVAGVTAVNFDYQNFPTTYNGSADVVDLYNDPDSYDGGYVSSAAEAIVNENLQKTKAANNVAAVVFDFRGFDTLGESFILLSAIAGTFVILSIHHKKKEVKDEEV